MSTPLSIEAISGRLLAAQRVLNPTLKKPITCRFALLTLSKQVSGVMLGDVECQVMEFFEFYWIPEDEDHFTGFFLSVEDAEGYLMASATDPE